MRTASAFESLELGIEYALQNGLGRSRFVVDRAMQPDERERILRLLLIVFDLKCSVRNQIHKRDGVHLYGRSFLL